MSLLPTFELSLLNYLCIENMSLKFYYLIAKLFTKFLPCYIIGLGS